MILKKEREKHVKMTQKMVGVKNCNQLDGNFAKINMSKVSL